MRVLIQMRHSPAVHAAAMKGMSEPEIGARLQGDVPGLAIDPHFPPVQVPGVAPATGGHLFSASQPLKFSMEPTESTYLVRGTIADGGPQSGALAAAAANPNVVGVFADPVIESCLTCGSSPPVGTDADVAKLLARAKFAAAGLTGTGVYLAIVDTGINVAHLQSKGRTPTLDPRRSWTPKGVTTTPGNHPVNHGTMCAYDAGILAPKATLLDHAVLLSKTPGATVMAGLLSDAVLAYSKLRTILLGTPPAKRAMVVSNSWGMFSPAWDFPPGHPGNYSDNPAHPFNIMVGSLAAAGADILFAAGNCGRDCPDGRCAFNGAHPICGANSHPAVLSIAGVDIKKKRVGYSSQGPGRLTSSKPDVAAYTHFEGSGVYPEDSGTSAACPVAAGVVAAVRTKYPTAKLSSLQLRALIKKTAEDKGGTGFDYDYGWGILDAAKLLAALP